VLFLSRRAVVVPAHASCCPGHFRLVPPASWMSVNPRPAPSRLVLAAARCPIGPGTANFWGGFPGCHQPPAGGLPVHPSGPPLGGCGDGPGNLALLCAFHQLDRGIHRWGRVAGPSRGRARPRRPSGRTGKTRPCTVRACLPSRRCDPPPPSRSGPGRPSHPIGGQARPGSPAVFPKQAPATVGTRPAGRWLKNSEKGTPSRPSTLKPIDSLVRRQSKMPAMNRSRNREVQPRSGSPRPGHFDDGDNFRCRT